jgi:hypothetical protein
VDLLNLVWHDLNNPRIWKRAPTLARDIYQNHYARYRAWFNQSRRFNVDGKALRIASELANEGPSKMAERLCLARLPFPTVWLEYSLHDKLRIGEELGISRGVADTSPSRIGYLLREDPGDPLRWSVITWVSIDNIATPVHKPHQGEMLASVAMHSWMVDTAMRATPERLGDINSFNRKSIIENIKVENAETDSERGEVAADAFPHLGWGYGASLGDMSKYQEYDSMRVLGVSKPLDHSIGVGWEPLSWQIKEVSSDDINRQFVESCVESRGDVRLIVSLLALINEVPIELSPAQQKGAFTGAGGVIKKYLTNNTVTISIPSKKPMRQIRKILSSKAKSHKARHEVRGHWRTIIHKDDHVRKVTHPDGSIEELFFAKGQLERVWVKAHERGDATYGYVIHKYDVQARGKKSSYRSDSREPAPEQVA